MSADEITTSGGFSIELWLAGGEDQIEQVALQRRVWEELAGEDRLANAGLRVEVVGRVAVLEGTVGQYALKLAAERAARRVAGLAGVENRIGVLPPAASAQTDAELALAAARALEWNALVPAKRVTVRVEGGVVTLGGEVDRGSEREAAEDAVSGLPGVTDVRNRIAVRPPVHPDHLRERIRAAVRQEHARHVAVELRGEQVVLRGRISSLAERDELEHAVWAVAGIAAIDDRVEVAP